MKSCTIAVICLLIPSINLGQGTQQQTGEEQERLKEAKVSELIIRQFGYIDGKPQDTGTLYAQALYDENGRLIKYNSLPTSGSIWSYKYDKHGNKIEIVSQMLATGYVAKVGHQVEAISYNSSDLNPDTLTTLTLNSYDIHGNLTSFIQYGFDGEVDIRYKAKYDYKNDLIQTNYSYSWNTHRETCFEYTYEDTLLVKRTTYGGNKTYVFNKVYYQHNSDGKRIDEERYAHNSRYIGDSVLSFHRTISYDESGYKSEEARVNFDTWKKKNKMESKSTFKYDRHGNVLEEIVYNAKGKIHYYNGYEYDYHESGLIKEKRWLDQNGQATHCWKYDYTSFED